LVLNDIRGTMSALTASIDTKSNSFSK
jgi:hypothetical protein